MWFFNLTFADGSQESCSDSGLGDHEPVGGGTLISHPLPLVQPQDEFYDQASPDKRTEADGNSDPNSGESLTELCLPELLWSLFSIPFSFVITEIFLSTCMNIWSFSS